MNPETAAATGEIGGALTARQRKLLQMIEHGGISRFMALVDSGSISREDVEKIAALYAKRSSSPNFFARLLRRR